MGQGARGWCGAVDSAGLSIWPQRAMLACLFVSLLACVLCLLTYLRCLGACLPDACLISALRALLAYLLGCLRACLLGFCLRACVRAGLLARVRARLFLLACMSACPLTCFCRGRFCAPVGACVRQAAVSVKGGVGLRFFARRMFRREWWVVLKKNNLLTLA